METKLLDIGYYQDVLNKSNIKIGDKLIFCDIDGTIFRDSLYIEIFLGLIYDSLKSTNPDKKQIAKSNIEIYENAFQKWKNRELTYDKYLETTIKCFTNLITGMPVNTFNKMCEKIVDEKAKRTYIYPLFFLKTKQKEGYKIILISGSPDYVVKNFAIKHNFDIGVGSYYFVSKEKFSNNEILTGEKILLATSKNKEELVNYIFNTYKPSYTISLGDTNGDYKMLTMTNEGIAINPSFELFDKIKNLENINVVVERKDLIIHLDKKQRTNISYFNNMQLF